jgi:uncharacterized protein YjbI with pentapeptide repeats
VITCQQLQCTTIPRSRANLIGANLSRANLSRASLSRANLSGADLGGAYHPNAKSVQALMGAGYESDSDGYLRKRAAH